MIIVVGAEKGGVAKSATAITLAVKAVQAGIETELIDTDMTGTSKNWCRLRKSLNVQPYIPLKAEMDDYKRDLLHEATKYSLLIVDIGAKGYDALVESAMVADMVIIPTGPDQGEVDSTVKVMRNLAKLDDQHRLGRVPAWVLMCRTPAVKNSREGQALREFMMECNVPLLDTVIPDRTVWRQSRREGRAVHEVCKRNGEPVDVRAAAEADALFNEIMAKLAEQQQRQAVAA
jgi:chromosome partitioning protein